MKKKEAGKKVWNLTKKTISVGVGMGTAFVTTAICTAYAPGATASTAAKVAFEAGKYGLSALTGTVAADLTEQEIELMERGIKLNILAAKEKKSEVVA